MTRRQAIKAARKRGLVTKAEAEVAAPRRHRRHCPACGGTFLPITPMHRGFCCACCAYSWGELRYAGKLDRRVGVGVEVVLIETGEIVTVTKVQSLTEAVVRTAAGQRLTVTHKDVERVQYLIIEHGSDCRRR